MGVGHGSRRQDKMRKIIFGLLFLGFCQNAFAVNTDKYIVQRPDGGVSIVTYIQGSNKSLENVLRDFGFDGYPVSPLKDGDLPKDRTDRNSWTRLGSKVIVDPAKKAE